MVDQPFENAKMRRTSAALTLAVGCMLWRPVVAAEDASSQTTEASGDSNALQEIVVSAEKRTANLQDTPITVSAFDASALQTAGVTSSADLGMLTPGLEFGNQFGYGQPHLRGIGTVANGPGVENPVALYVDGVYLGPMAGSTLSLNSIQDVEVLKGPQGTLFGRNATGGLIQVTTKDPQQAFGGTFGVGYGNYNTWGSDLYVTGGVTDAIAGNLAVHFSNQSTGYGTNAFNGLEVNKNQDLAARTKWTFSPDEATEFKFIGDYERSTSIPALPPAPGTTPLGGPPYTGHPQGLDGYFQPHGVNEGGGASLQAQHQFGFGQLVSITSYRKSSMDQAFDGSLVTDPDFALNIEIWDKHSQFTQEFQLSSLSDSSIKWIVGLYFYDADGQYAPIALTGGLLFPATFANTFSDQKDLSVAGYGQATKEIFDATNLTLGMRYTWEQRKFSNYEVVGFEGAGPEAFDGGAATVHYTKPTWRASLDHRFSDALLAYVSYNRGFKSGGFNDDLVPTTVYKPETLDAYELGAKMDLMNRRLRVDASTFLYSYQNIQAITYPAGLELIYNGAKAKLYGLDLAIDAKLMTGLTLSTGLELLHSQFTSFPNADFSTPAPGGGTNFGTFDATGKHLAQAPGVTYDLTLNYTLPTVIGQVAATATYAYNSGWYCDPDNRLHQGAYNLVNANMAWTSLSGLYKASIWGKNLSNTQYLTALASQGNGDYSVYAPPRTYGFNVERRF
jgi:iron complex outermembrane receptor protein